MPEVVHLKRVLASSAFDYRENAVGVHCRPVEATHRSIGIRRVRFGITINNAIAARSAVTKLRLNLLGKVMNRMHNLDRVPCANIATRSVKAKPASRLVYRVVPNHLEVSCV